MEPQGEAESVLKPAKLLVAVTGVTGTVGRRLTTALTAASHTAAHLAAAPPVSQNVIPQNPLQQGYEFSHETAVAATRAQLRAQKAQQQA